MFTVGWDAGCLFVFTVGLYLEDDDTMRIGRYDEMRYDLRQDACFSSTLMFNTARWALFTSALCWLNIYGQVCILTTPGVSRV
jgi:hypothetical protein